MAVYLNGIILGLVKDVNLFLVGDEHLLRSVMRGGGGEGYSAMGVRTIMADTKLSPTSTIEPGFWATAAEASPRASKGRVGCMARYSEAKY